MSLIRYPHNIPQKNFNYLVLLFIVAALGGSSFAFFFDHPVESDAVQYDLIGRNLAEGNGLSLSTTPPFVPTMAREPAYPFFLAMVYRVFSHNYRVVQVFQILIFSFTCILVFFIARDVFNEKIATYSATLTAICPTLANYPSYLLSETLFTFLLVLSIFCLTQVSIKRNLRWCILSGWAVGVGVLCKAVLALFFIPVLLWVIFTKGRYGSSARKSMKMLSFFLLTFIVVVLPWIWRNYSTFNAVNITHRGELALWMRAVKVEHPSEKMKQALIYNFSEYLGSVFFPDAVENPRDFILNDSKRAYGRRNQLIQAGFSPVEAGRIMRKEALDKIRQHPLRYLAQTPLEFIKQMSFIYIPVLNENHIVDKFHKIRGGKFILFPLKGIFRLSAYLIFLLAMIGIVAERKRWPSWYFLAAAVIYINLVYSLLFGLGRYAVPLIPFYLIFATVGYFKVGERIKLKKKGS